jgi:hypothetical protein
MFRPAYLACALLILASCGKSDQPYRIGDEPLLRKVFEDALTKDGIPFSTKGDGSYVTLAPYANRIDTISAESIARMRNSSLLSIGDPCEATRMRTLLNDRHVLFAENVVNRRMVFHVTREDADRLQLVKQHASHANECWAAEREVHREERERLLRERGIIP